MGRGSYDQYIVPFGYWPGDCLQCDSHSQISDPGWVLSGSSLPQPCSCTGTTHAPCYAIKIRRWHFFTIPSDSSPGRPNTTPSYAPRRGVASVHPCGCSRSTSKPERVYTSTSSSHASVTPYAPFRSSDLRSATSRRTCFHLAVSNSFAA